MKKDATESNKSPKQIVKKKIIGMFQKDVEVWEARKAASPNQITDNQLFRNLLHGADSFGPLAESILAEEMARTGMSRAATIERAIIESKREPPSL